MKINDELITYLEKLSKLRLTNEEAQKAKTDLTKILDYIDKLNELDTLGIEAMSHPTEFTNNFREDMLKISCNREELMSNAVCKKDGCFKVPKTVE